ncbi:hypothetical protein ACVBEQ_15485 [Nakamurella sp. GG22]
MNGLEPDTWDEPSTARCLLNMGMVVVGAVLLAVVIYVLLVLGAIILGIAAFIVLGRITARMML